MFRLIGYQTNGPNQNCPMNCSLEMSLSINPYFRLSQSRLGCLRTKTMVNHVEHYNLWVLHNSFYSTWQLLSMLMLEDETEFAVTVYTITMTTVTLRKTFSDCIYFMTKAWIWPWMSQNCNSHSYAMCVSVMFFLWNSQNIFKTQHWHLMNDSSIYCNVYAAFKKSVSNLLFTSYENKSNRLHYQPGSKCGCELCRLIQQPTATHARNEIQRHTHEMGFKAATTLLSCHYSHSALRKPGFNKLPLAVIIGCVPWTGSALKPSAEWHGGHPKNPRNLPIAPADWHPVLQVGAGLRPGKLVTTGKFSHDIPSPLKHSFLSLLESRGVGGGMDSSGTPKHP